MILYKYLNIARHVLKIHERVERAVLQAQVTSEASHECFNTVPIHKLMYSIRLEQCYSICITFFELYKITFSCTVDSRYSGLFGSRQFVRYIGFFRYIEFKFVTFLSILPKIQQKLCIFWGKNLLTMIIHLHSTVRTQYRC